MIKLIVFTHEPVVVPLSKTDLQEIGARVEFYGIVRATERERRIEGLQYEAYEPMARQLLDRIIDELVKEHRCDEVCFVHRLGWVPVGEASLYIRVLSSHRQEAFQFAARLIDRLKEDVPVWKSNGHSTQTEAELRG